LAPEVTHHQGIRPTVHSPGDGANFKALGKMTNFLAYKSLPLVSGTANYKGGIDFEFDEGHLPKIAEPSASSSDAVNREHDLPVAKRLSNRFCE
jgi:hypothetical protein